MMTCFAYKQDSLYGENVNLSELAQEIGTPFYVYSSSQIKSNYASFVSAFSDIPTQVCYAMKANSNQAVLATLARLGSGLDIVSCGELVRAQHSGVPGERICFSGVGKTPFEMAAALDYGIGCFNVESEEELSTLSRVAHTKGCMAPVALRVNPNISAQTHKKITTGTANSKFGIPCERVIPLYMYAKNLPGIAPVGIDMHLGSQMTDLAPLDKALERLVGLVSALRAQGITLKHIDVGGGLGIPYHDHDHVPTLQQYAALVKRHIAPLELQLIVEPGRFLVGNAGVLVVRILYRKTTEKKTFLVVDGGMNDLIRPTLYDMPHMVLPVRFFSKNASYETVDVVGPVCESGDYLSLGCVLPEGCQSGDLLAVMTAGAYGAVLSSTYNSRRLVPEVMVCDEAYAVVRARPSYEDLIAKECLPSWLSEKED